MSGNLGLQGNRQDGVLLRMMGMILCACAVSSRHLPRAFRFRVWEAIGHTPARACLGHATTGALGKIILNRRFTDLFSHYTGISPGHQPQAQSGCQVKAQHGGGVLRVLIMRFSLAACFLQNLSTGLGSVPESVLPAQSSGWFPLCGSG